MAKPGATGMDTLAVLAIPLTALMFAGNVLGARYAPGIVEPITLAFGRWGVFMLIMLPFVGLELWRSRAAILAEWRHLLVLGALGIAICGAFPYYAGHTTTATNLALIYTASPALTILFSGLLLGERLRPLQMLGVALALLGVLVIVLKGDPMTLLRLTFVPGDLWILGAALSWTGYSLLIKRWPSRLSGPVRLVALVGMAMLVLTPFTAWEVATLGPPRADWSTIGLVLFLALVPGAGAYQLHAWTTRRLGAGRTALNGYIMPVFAALLAWALLGERFAPYHVAGAVLALGGTWLANRQTAH